MHFAGDSHNFGQRVCQINEVSGSFFQKPRSVFWEWLFFGKDSPLQSIVTDAERKFGGFQGNPVGAKSIFALEVEQSSDKKRGRSKAILSGKVDRPVTDEELYAFGFLLGYCTLFGIRDLHRPNLVRGVQFLHAVDAEVVFAKLLLPCETLLLPFKETTFERSGVGHLFRNGRDITLDQILALLKGYCTLFEAICSAKEGIVGALGKVTEIAQEVPIRHILRDTAVYRNIQAQQIAVELLPEEIVQLQRGDIPYFFKFMGKPELFYYTSDTGTFKTVSVPARHVEGVKREAQPPEILLNDIRVTNEVFAPGLFYILKSSFHDLDALNHEIAAGFNISLKFDTFKLISPWGIFEAKRSRR
jgi:hypothetical protein